MGTTKGKFLYRVTPKNYSDGDVIKMAVYGIFDTETAMWKYYIISYEGNGQGFSLTHDLCTRSTVDGCSYSDIRKYGKEVQTVDDGKKELKEFTTKWETGSNNSKAEIRKEKLDDILGDEKEEK